jgi:Rho GDP-dissociation inhibitor
VSSLDQEDEAMNRWKASLGLGGGEDLSDANDPRRCIIQSLALEVEGRSDITIDLSAPGALENLKSKPFTIKEGAKFRMKAVFKVQHEVLSGLKYLQVVKRKGIRVSKDEEMLVSARSVQSLWKTAHILQGSYAPSTSEKPTYEKKCKASMLINTLPLLTSRSQPGRSTIRHDRSWSLPRRFQVHR